MLQKKLTQRTNKCKYKLLKIKLTELQNELLHGQSRSARHTGEPVENEDARRWNGRGEHLQGREGGIKQPQNSQACTVNCIVSTYPWDPFTEDSLGPDSKQTAQTN